MLPVTIFAIFCLSSATPIRTSPPYDRRQMVCSSSYQCKGRSENSPNSNSQQPDEGRGVFTEPHVRKAGSPGS